MSFHCSRRSHGIFSPNTKRVKEQTDSIHDNPSRQSLSPHGRQQYSTNEHDNNILNHSPSTSNPVTDNANSNLSKDNTHNLQVIDTCDQVDVASLVTLPTIRPNGLKQSRQIPNREQCVSLHKQAHTSEYTSGKV